MKITKPQIKALQSIRHKVFTDSDAYHDWLLANYKKKSTLELTTIQAREAISLLLQGTGDAGQTDSRPRGVWLTRRQYGKIKALEKELGWQDNPKRIRGFIRRQLKLNKTINMLTISEAQKVITGMTRLTKEMIKD